MSHDPRPQRVLTNIATILLTAALVLGQGEPPVFGAEPQEPAPAGSRTAAGNAGESLARVSDWPGWRGPGGDGFSPEVPQRLPPKKLLWSQPLAGECHAPVSVGAGYVVVADHGNQRDYWRCFRTVDGAPVGSYEYANAEKMEFGAAPRSAPRIHQGKVFCQSAWGELFCLELGTGRVIWKKQLASEFPQKTPTWGFCCSPLIADGRLIIHPGGSGEPVAALEADTGRLLWTGAGNGLNYASFLYGTFGGVKQIVGYDAKTAGGWDVRTGRRLWTLAVEASYGYIVSSPVTVAGKLLLTSDQENARLFGFQATGQITQEPAAENEELAPEISTPTVWGDCVLGTGSGLVLLDPGPPDSRGRLKTLWRYDAEDCVHGLCHLIVSADRALVLCQDGQLLLLAADRKACTILDRQQVCERTWTYPALAGGRLYVRDRHRLYCYDMEEGPRRK